MSEKTVVCGNDSVSGDPEAVEIIENNLRFSECGSYSLKTATGAVKASAGLLVGFYVNSTSSGTIIFYDDPDSADSAFTGTITPGVGWHSLPAVFTTGLYIAIGGTLNVTIIYK